MRALGLRSIGLTGVLAATLLGAAGCGDDAAAVADAGADSGASALDAAVSDGGCDAMVRVVSPRVSEVGCGPLGCRIGSEACCVHAATAGSACGGETYECVALGAATGCDAYLECDPRDRSGSCPSASYCCRERAGAARSACVSETMCATGEFVCYADADCPVDRPRCARSDGGASGVCSP